jgi:hypothetical protein
MAAPSIRSLGTVTSGATAAPSFAEPLGAAADDIIVCGWFQDDARTSISATLPTGFAAAFDAPQANNPLTGSSPDHSLQVYVARRSVCGAGPYTFTVVPGTGGATPFCEGMAVAVQGVPPGIASPFTEAADGNTSGSSSSATAPLVTATSLDIDRLALYFATNWTGGAWTPPSGYTEDWDANNRIATLDHLTMAVAASTSPQAVNVSTDRTNAWVGIFASSIAAAAPTSTGPPALPPHILLMLAGRNQAQWQNATDASTAWTVDQADSAGLTDTSVLDRTLVATDSTGLTDSAILDRGLTATDSAGLTDSSILDRGLVVTDSSGLTDSLATLLAKIIDQADSAGLTDTDGLARGLVPTDSAGLTDSSALDRSIFTTDSAGLTDSSALDRSIFTTDSAGLTDTDALASVRAVTDSAGLTDSSAIPVVRTFTDSAGLTDSLTAALPGLVSPTGWRIEAGAPVWIIGQAGVWMRIEQGPPAWRISQG